jgi:hypothetical protein
MGDESMHEVPYVQEQSLIELPELHYVGPPAEWASRFNHRGRFITQWIGGEKSGPYTQLLQLAKLVLPKLYEIESASDSYLREFINYAENFYQGSWKVQSVRVLWAAGSKIEAGSEFEVTLWIAEDDYGEWGVRFIRDTYPSRVFRPFAFSRTQR